MIRNRALLPCTKAKRGYYSDRDYLPDGCGNYHSLGINTGYVGFMLRATHWKHNGPGYGFYLPRISFHRSYVVRLTLAISLNGYDLQAQAGFRYKKVK